MILGSRYKNDGIPTLKLNDLQVDYIHRVQSKILQGIYTFETVPCVICGGTSMEEVAQKDRYGFRLDFVLCKSCGLGQTNPRMDQNSYNHFYNDEYRYIYGGEIGPTETFFNDQYFRLGKKIYEFVENASKSESLAGKFVLEIGCGAGGILKYFRDKGCLVKGIDLGSEFIEYGRKEHNLDLMVGEIKSLNLDRSPDIIIYSHVLEHILDLKGQLRKIFDIMHKDTILYIEVPGLKNLHRSYEGDLLLYLQNAHVYHFTKTSLLGLMRANGFEVILIDEYVRSLFKQAESTNSIFSLDEYQTIIRYLKMIELMRKLLPIPIYVIRFRIKRGIYKLFRFFRLVSPLKS